MQVLKDALINDRKFPSTYDFFIINWWCILSKTFHLLSWCFKISSFNIWIVLIDFCGWTNHTFLKKIGARVWYVVHFTYWWILFVNVCLGKQKPGKKSFLRFSHFVVSMSPFGLRFFWHSEMFCGVCPSFLLPSLRKLV